MSNIGNKASFKARQTPWAETACETYYRSLKDVNVSKFGLREDTNFFKPHAVPTEIMKTPDFIAQTRKLETYWVEVKGCGSGVVKIKVIDIETYLRFNISGNKLPIKIFLYDNGRNVAKIITLEYLSKLASKPGRAQEMLDKGTYYEKPAYIIYWDEIDSTEIQNILSPSQISKLKALQKKIIYDVTLEKYTENKKDGISSAKKKLKEEEESSDPTKLSNHLKLTHGQLLLEIYNSIDVSKSMQRFL